MKPEPRIVDGVPLCVETCQHAHLAQVPGDDFYCRHGKVTERTCDGVPCYPAICNLVAHVAEVKRLCQAANRPDNPLSAQSLAAGVLHILEDSE